MRTKLNLDSSLDSSLGSSMESSLGGSLGNSQDRGIAGKLAISGLPLSRMPISSMPLEWLGAGSWRLPSGKALAEFALQAGFLAPLLFNGEKFNGEKFGGKRQASGAGTLEADRAGATRAKQCAKGSGQ